ncbi:unnamed protein product [Moneuplotes crassus]|uniref:Uncharacterized protein n=1 Tax=Euplotes crassus TaxID=5936 RepID=A0AAD1XH02_EUPCR|nr:unnamed protein product [Moneuplotes crassus]
MSILKYRATKNSNAIFYKLRKKKSFHIKIDNSIYHNPNAQIHKKLTNFKRGHNLCTSDERNHSEESLAPLVDQGAQGTHYDQETDKIFINRDNLGQTHEKTFKRRKEINRFIRVYLNSATAKMREKIMRPESNSETKSRMMSRNTSRGGTRKVQKSELQITEMTPLFTNKMIKKSEIKYRITKKMTQKWSFRKSSCPMNQKEKTKSLVKNYAHHKGISLSRSCAELKKVIQSERDENQQSPASGIKRKIKISKNDPKKIEKSRMNKSHTNIRFNLRNYFQKIGKVNPVSKKRILPIRSRRKSLSDNLTPSPYQS